MIYLNNAGTSWPKAPGVIEAAHAALAATPDEYSAVYAGAHAAVAGILGAATEPDRLLITSGCTSALAIALGDLPWQPGDVVLTTSLEHHALARQVHQLVRTRSVEHRRSPYVAGQPIDLEWLRTQLSGGDIRLIAMTGASNVTGEIVPHADVVRLAREHDALVLVDAAQTAGVVPLDLESGGADIVVFAGHKGPLGPQGVGGLWFGERARFECSAAVCEVSFEGGRPTTSARPGFCDVGSVNLAGLMGLAAGLTWLGESGQISTTSSAIRLRARLFDALLERGCVQVFGGRECPSTGTVSFRLDGMELAEAETWFADRGIILRAGSHCAPWALDALGSPQGVIRVSFGPFNPDSDVDAVLAAIDEIPR